MCWYCGKAKRIYGGVEETMVFQIIQVSSEALLKSEDQSQSFKHDRYFNGV